MFSKIYFIDITGPYNLIISENISKYQKWMSKTLPPTVNRQSYRPIESLGEGLTLNSVTYLQLLIGVSWPPLMHVSFTLWSPQATVSYCTSNFSCWTNLMLEQYILFISISEPTRRPIPYEFRFWLCSLSCVAGGFLVCLSLLVHKVTDKSVRESWTGVKQEN